MKCECYLDYQRWIQTEFVHILPSHNSSAAILSYAHGILRNILKGCLEWFVYGLENRLVISIQLELTVSVLFWIWQNISHGDTSCYLRDQRISLKAPKHISWQPAPTWNVFINIVVVVVVVWYAAFYDVFPWYSLILFNLRYMHVESVLLAISYV